MVTAAVEEQIEVQLPRHGAHPGPERAFHECGSAGWKLATDPQAGQDVCKENRLPLRAVSPPSLPGLTSQVGFTRLATLAVSTRPERRLLGRSVAPQVGVDGERRVIAEARTVELHVLHHALHVVAGFHERDALDPVDGIDLRVARIAELRDPLLHATAPG